MCLCTDQKQSWSERTGSVWGEAQIEFGAVIYVHAAGVGAIPRAPAVIGCRSVPSTHHAEKTIELIAARVASGAGSATRSPIFSGGRQNCGCAGRVIRRQKSDASIITEPLCHGCSVVAVNIEPRRNFTPSWLAIGREPKHKSGLMGGCGRRI